MIDRMRGMNRRSFLGQALALAAVAGTPTALQAQARTAKRRPNIVFILADDMGYGDPSVYGQRRFKTPTIDRLAAEGVRFTQGYAGDTVCAPSRCALMTGMNGGHERVRDNFALAAGHLGYKGKQEIRRASLEPQDRTVADYLKAAGYATGLMGKWHLDGYDPGAVPNKHGFDEFKGWLTQTESTQGYYPPQRYHNETLINLPGNQNGARGQYDTTMITDDSIDFISRHKASPFFLYVAYDAPHSPYVSPDFGPFAKESWDDDEKTYADMIVEEDKGIARIMAAIKAAGIDGETIVFFASDNGPRSEPTPEQTKVIDFFDSNGALRGYKRDMYDGGIKDPFIVRWPGHVPAGTVCDMPTYFPDFLPTALGLAGAAPEPNDGLDITPWLLQPAKPFQDRPLYFEFYEPKYEQAVRWGRWKAVRHGREGKLELYDLKVDPAEKNNVADANPEVVARMNAYIKSAHHASPEYPDPAPGAASAATSMSQSTRRDVGQE